jgi:cytochrome c553
MKQSTKILLFLIAIVPAMVYLFFAAANRGYIDLPHKDRRGYAVDDMANTAIVHPQELSSIGSNTFFFELPENSVPREGNKYPLHQTEIDEGIARFEYNIQKNSAIIARAEGRYLTFCASCHGYEGHADGPVITKVETGPDKEGFPPPPDITLSATQRKSDARLFHILSAGQNLMFPVDYKLDKEERLGLVYYIRELQKKAVE